MTDPPLTAPATAESDRGPADGHGNQRPRTQPRHVRRPGEPRDGVPESAQDQVRDPEGPRTDGREGQADRQEGLRRLEPVSGLHRPLPRGGDRADRDPPPQPHRQELGRHPAGRRRDGSCLEQAPRRHLRDRLRRLRLLAAGLQAQGERQARHRPGHEGLDLRAAPRQLRRVHLLRRPRTPGAGRAAPRHELAGRHPRAAARGHHDARGSVQRPAPREPRDPLCVDDQGDDEAQEALVRRELLRLPELHPSPGRRRRQRRGRHRA